MALRIDEGFRKQKGVRAEVRINTTFALSTELLFGLQKSIFAKVLLVSEFMLGSVNFPCTFRFCLRIFSTSTTQDVRVEAGILARSSLRRVCF